MSDKPIYYYLPNWMSEELKERQCDQCGHGVAREDVIAIGIRENKDNNKTIYMEHQCPNCEYREMTSCGGNRKGTLDEMCYILIEEVQRRKSIERAKKLRKINHIKKPWTDKEVDDFKQYMKKCSSYEQFLEHIRASKYLGEQKYNDEKPSAED